MNQNLIDSIVAITGQEEAYVQEKLSTFQVDDLYELMDLVRNKQESEIVARIGAADPELEPEAPEQEVPEPDEQQTEPEEPAPVAPDAVPESVAKPSSFDVIVKMGQRSKDGLLDWLDDHSITYAHRPNDIIIIKSANQAKETEIKQEIDLMKAKDDSIKILNDSMKPTKKDGLPKPRDPMAKALSLGQYQPKIEPSKQEKLEKKDRKHKKGYLGDAIDMSDIEVGHIAEGVMGMTQMDSMLPRMLQLAGMQSDTSMSPLVSIDTTSNPDVVTMSINTDSQEVPQLEFDPEVTSNFDTVNDVEFDDLVLDDEIDPLAPLMSSDGLTSIQVMRNSFSAIGANLSEIRVGEFSEVRNMLSDLMSQIDRMGNNISGK